MKVLADGSLLFDTKVDTSGLKNALSGIGGIASSAFGIASKAVAAVSAGLGAGAAASVKFGSEFETSFAKASTLFGDVAVDTDNLNKKILEMSSSSGVAASDLNETLYQAMSAGIPVTEDMAEALNAVEVANKLAVGGYTSSATAMKSLTGAINAYNLPASDAKRISDELITVQNKGVTSVDELASNMGKAISTASAYGVNLENLNAGYISLTKNNIETAEATTYMSSMFNELGDSGSKVSSILQNETGMTFGQMMNNGYNLADAMDMLSESVNGDTEALMNLWGSAEAGKAANAIVKQGTDNFRQSLDDLANSTGATETAYNTMMDTFEGKKSILTENAKNLGISIYEGMKDQASGMLDIANDYIAQLQAGFEENGTEGLIMALGGVISDLVGRVAELAPQVIELAIEIISQLGQALVDNTPQLVTAAYEIVRSLIIGIISANSTLVDIGKSLITTIGDTVKNNLPEIEERGSDLFSKFCDAIRKYLPELVSTGFEMITNLVTGILNNLPSVISQAGNMLTQFLGAILDALPSLLDAGVEMILNLLNGIIKSAPAILASINKLLADIIAKIAQKLPDILKKGVEIITKLNIGIFKAVPDLLSKIPEIVKGIADSFLDKDWGEIGLNIIKGLINGITSGVGSIIDAAKNAAKSALDAAESVLGINSPSKKFAWIGKMCVEGFEQPLEKYNPYDTLAASMKANKSTLNMNYQVGSETYLKEDLFDYSEFGKETVAAFEKAGLTVSIDKRPFGRIVRGVTV